MTVPQLRNKATTHIRIFATTIDRRTERLVPEADVKAGLIRIRQRAQNLKGTSRHTGPPQSAAGIRDVPIAEDVPKELTLAKAEAEAKGLEWVCVDDKDSPLHPKHVPRLIKDGVTKAGFDGSDGHEVPTVVNAGGFRVEEGFCSKCRPNGRPIN